METALDRFDEDEEEQGLTVASEGTAAAIAKSEVEAQLDAAHKYKRSVTRFMQEAQTLATISQEVAESCIYALPRGGKTISGPSVRLAEICASAWGNLHVAARVVAVEDKDVVAQGGAWDLEKNLRVTVETRRKITGSNGRRFNEDMINMTGNAAASIALRNAVFRVIPRAYIDRLYERVRKVAVGDATTLANRRASLLEKLGKMGASQDRVLAAMGKTGVEDIGLAELETLIGYGTAIKEGSKTVDELFPAPVAAPPAAEDQGRKMPLGERGKAKAEQRDGKKLQIEVTGAAAPPPPKPTAAEREVGADDDGVIK